jgi:hypothetical protein
VDRPRRPAPNAFRGAGGNRWRRPARRSLSFRRDREYVIAAAARSRCVIGPSHRLARLRDSVSSFSRAWRGALSSAGALAGFRPTVSG